MKTPLVQWKLSLFRCSFKKCCHCSETFLKALSQGDAQMCGQLLLSSLISTRAGTRSSSPHPLQPLLLQVQAGHSAVAGHPAYTSSPTLPSHPGFPKDGSVTCQAASGPQHFTNLRRKVSQSPGQHQHPSPSSPSQVSRHQRCPHAPLTPPSLGAAASKREAGSLSCSS